MTVARESYDAIALGAGPAGLTAAVELGTHGRTALVLEASEQVGGISRTERRDGWRFDLGGHRFFTKVPRVREFWEKTLPEQDFLLRPRLSRIFYQEKFYDYPLRATNAIRNLGLLEAALCVLSYLRVRLSPPKDQSNFEGWVAARFGWRLYRKFFKTYTEKVWGVPAQDIQADWAAQRIKDLSLAKAIMNALDRRSARTNTITTLTESFHYPRFGPGMMWEACAGRAKELGQEVRLRSEVVQIYRHGRDAIGVVTRDGEEFLAQHVISSIPLGQLISALKPAPPSHVKEAAASLNYRDFLTVALVVPWESAFPDNWIYIHAPGVRVGRIQNFGVWSPDMVQDGMTCLGLEYFVNVGDDLWCRDDAELVDFARGEIEVLGLIPRGVAHQGYVVRVEKAYPVYDANHASAIQTIRSFLEDSWPTVHPVGRNGMHRYNNQDHSMLTAMVTVDSIVLKTSEDPWEVNVEPEYHESTGRHASQSGRDAPILRRS